MAVCVHGVVFFPSVKICSPLELSWASPGEVGLMGVVIFSCKGREDRLLKCAHPVIFTTAPDPTARLIERRPLPSKVALLRHLYSRDMRKPLPRVFFSIKSHTYTSNSPPSPPVCHRYVLDLTRMSPLREGLYLFVTRRSGQTHLLAMSEGAGWRCLSRTLHERLWHY